MTPRQKEIQSYIFIALMVFAIWGDSVYKFSRRGLDHSIEMEQKTGKHWITDLKGNPLGDY